MDTLLSDPAFMREDYRTEDLFDFSAYVSRLHEKIKSTPHNAMFGVVGQYGIGKSVMLETLRQRLPEDHIWVHFDAWKYPERHNLWEGFVLDFVRQVDPGRFSTVLKKMDGTSGKAAEELIKTFGSIGNIFLPGVKAGIDKLSYFTATSPAKRVFQIQDILQKLLQKHKTKPIFIVIEDADRAGDAGLFFIETLSHFLRNTELKNSIKVLVPIARTSFDDKRDVYIKALDYLDFFRITSRNFERFVEKVFAPELVADAVAKHHFVEWLQRLLAVHGLTFRDIKFIIRNSESQYAFLRASGRKPDPRIVLIIESTKYVSGDQGYDAILKRKSIPQGSEAETLLIAIAQSMTVDTYITLKNDRPMSALYRNAIQFVDKEVLGAPYGAALPFPLAQSFVMPLYYINETY